VSKNRTEAFSLKTQNLLFSPVYMAVRIVVLLVILGGLTLFALQNAAPLNLVFLGIKTQALPLGFWILAAVAAGFLTSLAIAWLLQIFNSFSNARLLSRLSELEAEKARKEQQSRENASSYPSYSYSSATENSSASESASTSSAKNEKWENEQEEEDSNYVDSQPNATERVSDRNYEVKKEPTSSYRSGSVYSYGYKNPSNSGVGRRESVVDAEYRVITPPYRPLEPEEPKPSQQSNKKIVDDDDWGFDDDDDFDDDDFDKKPRSRS